MGDGSVYPHLGNGTGHTIATIAAPLLALVGPAKYEVGLHSNFFLSIFDL